MSTTAVESEKSVAPPLNLGISFLREWMHILGYKELSSVSPDSLHGCCKSGNIVLLMKLLLLNDQKHKQTKTIVDEILSQQLPLTPLFFACLENNQNIIDLLLFRHHASLQLTSVAVHVDEPVSVPEGSHRQGHFDVGQWVAVPSVWHIVCATGNATLLRKFLRKVWTEKEEEESINGEDKDDKDVKSTVAVMQFDPLSSLPAWQVDEIKKVSRRSFLHPITLACVYGHSKIVKCLFNFYQDFTNVDLATVGCYRGLNLLMLACFSRNYQLLAYLLEHEATKHLIRVHAVSSNVITSNVLWQRFKCMLDASCEFVNEPSSCDNVSEELVDKVFKYEFSPLILCVCLQWFDAVELLLQVATEVQLDQQHHKHEHGGERVMQNDVSDVIGYCCLHTVNPTALHWAASSGNCDILDILTHYQFKRVGRTLKVGDIGSQKETLVRKRQGGESEKKRKGGGGHVFFSNNTPLHSAVRLNQLACALRLLHLCPHWVNVGDGSSNLPLHYACLHKNIHLFNALIHKTRNAAQVTGENGYTALHFLCLPQPSSAPSSSSNAKDDVILLMFRSLVSLGADVCKRDAHDGCTALHLAIEFHPISLFLSLLNTFCVPDPNSSSTTSKQESNVVNVQDFEGRTLLHYAAEMNSMELSQKLLRLDANVESEDKQGKRALHLATDAAFACFLIEHGHGAQLNAQDTDGMSPLHLAVIRGDLDMIALLLSYPDVNFQLTTRSGMNVLHLACEQAPSSGDRALLVLKQLINNIANCSLLDVCVQSEYYRGDGGQMEEGEQQQKGNAGGGVPRKSAINCAIRPDNDRLSLEMLKVLFAYGLHQAQGDLLLALKCAIRYELICTCTFLLQAFKSRVGDEMMKTLLFFTIGRANSYMFHFLLSHISAVASTENSAGSEEDILMDIEPVQNPFYPSCIGGNRTRESFSALRANNNTPQSQSSVKFNLLLYPIEWCIVTAAFQYSTRFRVLGGRIDESARHRISELHKIFNVIMSHCAAGRSRSQSSSSTSSSAAASSVVVGGGSIHKFDFFTNRSIMNSVLKSASDNQTIFHMLTQWLSFNDMDPCVVLSNLLPPNNNSRETAPNDLETPPPPPSSFLSPFLSLPKSLLFIMTLYKSCSSCASFWKNGQNSGSVWRTLLDSYHPDKPKVSSMLEVIVIRALGLDGSNSGAVGCLNEFIDKDDANILPAEDFKNVRLSQLCSTVVRTRYFSATQILRMQFHGKEGGDKEEEEEDQVPSFLIPLVAGGLLNVADSTKKSLHLCADYMQQLSNCCALLSDASLS